MPLRSHLQAIADESVRVGRKRDVRWQRRSHALGSELYQGLSQLSVPLQLR